MHSSRIQTLNLIADLCGETAMRILHPAQAWPALASVRLPDGENHPVALHVGSLGKSHRGRDNVERRFQNPGQGRPVQAPLGLLPLLVGLWDEQARPVLVGMDATRRLGEETRKSLFVPLKVLRAAQTAGWTEHVSASGERLIAFHAEEVSRYAALRMKDWIRVASRRVA